MLPFSLSITDANITKIERKTDLSKIIRDRMQILYLLGQGYSRSKCASIVGCHPNSVTNYIKLYQEGGLDRIRQLNYSRCKHELQNNFEEVASSLSQSNCSTISDVQHLLKEKFSYNRSIEAVRHLLHRLGFKRRKTGSFPGNPNDFDKWEQQQKDFTVKLYDLIDKAETGDIDLVFSDAAHFVYGKYSSYCWSKTVQYAPSGHGRYRINVYGAYDVISNQVYSMYNEGYINADFIVEYLEWIRKEFYTNKSCPLHLVLDNARYQHCKYVKEVAEKLNIKLEFLPGYSPNLNLIERLWNYLKKIIGKQYHQCKVSFENAIAELLKSLGNQEHQKKLWVLLNPEFQHFNKSQILTW